jgi:uncharacterized protein
MKYLLLVLFGLWAVGSMATASEHVVDPTQLISGTIARCIDRDLAKFEKETRINVLIQFHETSPSEVEDSEPGAFMRALSAKLGVLEKDVLIVYFADVDEWRVWIGNELTSRFVGKPGTAEEFTASGAMHDTKETWLAGVFADSEAAWKRWQQVARAIPQPIERVGFQAESLAAGIMAKLSSDHTTPGQDLLAPTLKGDIGAVKALLRRGTNLEVRDPQGRSPLMVATQGNHIELAKELIEAGADVNARDELQGTPYLYAGAEGRTEILKLTLAHGADLKSVNRFEGTALIPAAEKGHLENVRVLLKTDIDINHVNRPGWTALYEAVMRPRAGSETYRAIVSALLDAEAEETITDKEGRTPEQRAREVGNDDLADLIAAAKQ